MELFAAADRSVILVDIPRSIEEAQVLPGTEPQRRLISSPALEEPWQMPGSKPNKNADMTQPLSVMIGEMMVLQKVRDAFDVIRDAHEGPWCLPRLYTLEERESQLLDDRKRKKRSPEQKSNESKTDSSPYIPAKSEHLLGLIQSTRDTFLKTAPVFDLIILDPPWPSRSVRRKNDGYAIAYGMEEVHKLLSLVPVASHLDKDGLVAVWVTNKPAAIDLLTSTEGMFAQWGLEPVGEWVWVKTTISGQPVVNLESQWRKPWERLLIARKRGSSRKLSSEHKVIFGVPDLHSRKPNLRRLFEEVLPSGYVGLEVFARNLTAGWWSWGDQVLMFQQRHCWEEDDLKSNASDKSSLDTNTDTT